VNVEFHPIADAELGAAAEFYEGRIPGLGNDLLAEVERVCALLSENQSLGPRLDYEHRRVALRRFPFGLIYRVRNATVQIVAVAHRRRWPGYWRRRG
jgi:toxin ParE1/3/4